MIKVFRYKQNDAQAEFLEQIEQRIISIVGETSSELASIAQYLLSLGGKRIRPLVTILTSQIFGMQNMSTELIDAAAGIELIHTASLLHDDIIDKSLIRRKKESALKKYGEKASLLAGDFLFAKAFGLCARLDKFVVAEAENACIALATGEMLEQQISIEETPSIEEYFEVISKKTASLFSLSAIVGAHLAKARKKEVELLRKFGDLLGKSFQIADDLLDVLDDGNKLGKDSGLDLFNRTPSLPNILWLKSGDPEASLYFKLGSNTVKEFQTALIALRNSQAISETQEILEKTAADAISVLDMFSSERYNSNAISELKTHVEKCVCKGSVICKK